MKQPTSLNTLVEILGHEAAQRFLTFAQPQVRQCRLDLLTLLQQQDWDAAAALAHRFKATAHLYSSSTLLDYLEIIIAKKAETLQQATVLPRLEAEFQRIETDINIFMKNN